MFSIEPMIAAYFAGHFDGEGCISIIAEKRWGCMRIQLTVGSCNLPILLKYQSTFGGNIYNHHRPVKGWRDAGKWMLQNKIEAARFLLTIEPYSIEKKAQVSLALNFLTKYIEAYPPRWELERVSSELSQLKKVSFPFNEFKGIRNENLS